MPDRTQHKQDANPDTVRRSGRRFAVDIESPRDKTVCFTVSQEELDAIDTLAASVNRTRSSLLSRAVNAFVQDANERSGSPELDELLGQVRDGELPRETLKRNR